jgi:IQ and ubiquitin-like domain-containing protein
MFTQDPIADEHSLSWLGATANGIIQLKIASADPQTFPLKHYSPQGINLSQDVITVNVKLDELRTKEVIVEIERGRTRKPFLGGYRHKVLDKEYHNASVQTLKPPRPFDGITRYARDAQTVLAYNMSMQTRQDMSTQMTKPGLFVSRVDDKLLTPRPYQTADEWHRIRVESVIVIQKYTRRFLAKKRFNEIKRAYEERIKWEKEKELKRVKNIEERRQIDIKRRLNPKTKEDFEILYATLERWRLEEIEKINATKTGASRKAALAMLVDQEAELIATIERYKYNASQENKQKQMQFFLDKVSRYLKKL